MLNFLSIGFQPILFLFLTMQLADISRKVCKIIVVLKEIAWFVSKKIL